MTSAIDALSGVISCRRVMVMGDMLELGARCDEWHRAMIDRTIDGGIEVLMLVGPTYCRIAAEHGLAALPSAANFVAIDCGRDGDFARAVLAGLIERDVFVRMPFVAPQDRCIRVSAGTKTDLDVFAQALPDALQAARTRL